MDDGVWITAAAFLVLADCSFCPIARAQPFFHKPISVIFHEENYFAGTILLFKLIKAESHEGSDEHPVVLENGRTDERIQGGERKLSSSVARVVVTPQCSSWNSTLTKGNQDSLWTQSSLEEEWENQ